MLLSKLIWLPRRVAGSVSKRHVEYQQKPIGILQLAVPPPNVPMHTWIVSQAAIPGPLSPQNWLWHQHRCVGRPGAHVYRVDKSVGEEFVLGLLLRGPPAKEHKTMNTQVRSEVGRVSSTQKDIMLKRRVRVSGPVISKRKLVHNVTQPKSLGISSSSSCPILEALQQPKASVRHRSKTTLSRTGRTEVYLTSPGGEKSKVH